MSLCNYSKIIVNIIIKNLIIFENYNIYNGVLLKYILYNSIKSEFCTIIFKEKNNNEKEGGKRWQIIMKYSKSRIVINCLNIMSCHVEV
jgi:hypothetical protein